MRPAAGVPPREFRRSASAAGLPPRGTRPSSPGVIDGYRNFVDASRGSRSSGCSGLCGATLVVMNDNDLAQPPRAGVGGDCDADDPTGRLAAYQAEAQTPLDLLALVTLWLTVVPPWY